MTIQLKTAPSPLLSRPLVFVLLLGLILRCCSLFWNDRIQGDVNLFVLTAQEYVRNDELRYPMKMDYSPNVTWENLHSPQSQHPPLWSFAAGIIGKIVGSENTYAILQWMSFLVGVGLILVMHRWLNGFHFSITPTAMSLVALSPMLVDFCGNGSQYTLGGLFLLLAFVLLSQGKTTIRTTVLVGVFSGLAVVSHGAFLLMPIGVCAYLVTTKTSIMRKFHRCALCLLAFLVTISPMLLFNVFHFGTPFHSLNTIHIGAVLGQLSLQMDETRIFWNFDFALTFDAIKKYLAGTASAGGSFLLHLLFEWSPFGLALGIIGLRSLRKSHPVTAKVLLCLGISYLVPVLGWASFKYRFLAPILPFALILTAIGYHSCRDLGGSQAKWAKHAMIGMFLWFFGAWVVSSALTGSPTRYYAFDLKHKGDYSEMVEFAEQITKLERGTIVGSAKSLDGGIEGIYLHQFPYVHARGFGWDYLQRIRADFDATYFWTDQEMMKGYKENLVHLELVLSHGQFRLFRFPETKEQGKEELP